jgi:hypothetical protein
LIFACVLSGAARDVTLQAHEHTEWRWTMRAEIPQLGEFIPYLEQIIARGILG